MKTIGITGGKGGTGKSTVATALAVELGKNHKVLLADMDVDCPDDHLLLSINRKLMKNVYQRIPDFYLDKCTRCGLCGKVCTTNSIASVKGKKPIFMQHLCNGCGACLIKCPVDAISWTNKEIGKIYSGNKYGIDLLSGELRINEPLSEIVVDSVKELINHKKNDYDYIIIDTSAGIHCDVISALRDCDLAIAVTEPTPLGAHDLDLILKLLHKMKIPSKVMLNMTDIGKRGVTERVLNSHHTEMIAEIPFKKGVMEAYSKGIPIEDKGIKIMAGDVKEI